MGMKTETRNEAIVTGARALIRERLGMLAPSVNDETREQAVKDAETVILAAERAGLITIG